MDALQLSASSLTIVGIPHHRSNSGEPLFKSLKQIQIFPPCSLPLLAQKHGASPPFPALFCPLLSLSPADPEMKGPQRCLCPVLARLYMEPGSARDSNSSGCVPFSCTCSKYFPYETHTHSVETQENCLSDALISGKAIYVFKGEFLMNFLKCFLPGVRAKGVNGNHFNVCPPLSQEKGVY